ncbi:type II secretion system protein [Gorillibacterium sp. sgz500922]|uniref:type II secretion system protein n=1 Tax=Gorillibacterium sp. sgz500922 TaxID=3446694 RepID=UPI003F674CD4
MKVFKKAQNKKGLTLIELLAVLVIIGIIAAIAVPAINQTIERSRIKADKANQQLIRDAAIRYATENNLGGGTGATAASTATIGVSTDVSGRATENFVELGYLNNVISWNKTANTIDNVVITTDANGAITVTFYNGSTVVAPLN